MKRPQVFSIFIILIAVSMACYFFPLMPDRVASHWNSSGEVNGYMSKFWGLFLFPLIMIAVNVLLFVIPKIDPKKQNIEMFKESFDAFIVLLNLFLLYIYSLTIFWNMGYGVDMNIAIIPAMAVLFFYIGTLLGKTKRNYMIGIRLPWTLDNDVVWDKTHKKGEKVFKAIGIITLIGTFFSGYAMWFLFVPLAIGILYITIYSYLEFKKI